MSVSCHIHQHYSSTVISQLAAGLKISGNRQHFCWHVLFFLTCAKIKKIVYVYWGGEKPGTVVQLCP